MTDTFKPGDKVSNYNDKPVTIIRRKNTYSNGAPLEGEAYEYKKEHSNFDTGWDWARHLTLIEASPVYTPQKGDIVSVRGVVDFTGMGASDVYLDGHTQQTVAVHNSDLTLIERPKPVEPKLPGTIWTLVGSSVDRRLIVLQDNKYYDNLALESIHDMPANTDHWIKVAP